MIVKKTFSDKHQPTKVNLNKWKLTRILKEVLQVEGKWFPDVEMVLLMHKRQGLIKK